MNRAAATLLAFASLLPQVGVGFEPVYACSPLPCGCEVAPVVCCEPLATTGKREQPKPPAPLPTPADPAPTVNTTPPSAASALPIPSPAPAPDAISPPPLNTPAIAEMPTPPAESPAAADVTPQLPEPAPVEAAPRYTAPPAETSPAEPTTPAPAADELFPEPTEPSAPAEDPASTTPEYDSLFPPSSANEVLTQPGGWASDVSRPWIDAGGQRIVAGRITEVTASGIVSAGNDGKSRAVRYVSLSDADLNFVRQQIAARRAQLAGQAADARLAKQSR